MLNSKLKDILLITLTFCVVILFILLFNLKYSSNPTDAKINHSLETTKNTNNINTFVEGRIAFVNTDSINEKYLYISDIVKQMKARKEKIEAQLQSMMNQFQQDYEAYQQSVQAGIAPPSELEKQKRKLEQLQRDIQNKQLQMDNLVAEIQEKNEQLQKDIKEFMNRFNNGKYDFILSYSEAMPNVLYANPKYDITNEVIKALNDEYLQKSKQNK